MALNLSTCIVGGIEPVQLALTNNRLSVSSAASSWGIAFSIGADSQLFSALPFLNDNNTRVALANTCGSKSNASCVASLNGVYEPPDGVQATTDPTNWNGTFETWLQQGNTDGNNYLFFNDVMRIAGYDLLGLPFYSATDESTGDAYYSTLPLGLNSSFLEAALDVGMIGTNQWSIWTGNADENIDGRLILGGYDEARVDGPFTEFYVDEQLKRPYLQVTGMAWEGTDHDPINLMPNSTDSIWVLPEPAFYYLEVPSESYFKFVQVANSSGDAIYNSTSDRHQFYTIPTGDIIITLNNGVKTTIPFRELFLHPLYFDVSGVLQESNNSYYVTRLYPNYDQNANFFGLPFMNQKMFVADWDAGKFYMADAAQGDQPVTNVRPLCTPPTTTAPPPITTSPTPPMPSHKETNVAAIAGGVGGGVGGLLVIGLIAFFVLRKKRKAKQQTQQGGPQMYEAPYPASSPPPKYGIPGVRHVSEPEEAYYTAYSPPPQHMPPQEMSSPPHSPTPQRASYQARSDGASSDYYTGHPVGQEHHGDPVYSTLSGPLEMPTEHDERQPR